MICSEFIMFLDDYVDMKIDAREIRRFEEHLQECPDCMAFLESYRLTRTLTERAFCVPAPVPAQVPPQLIQAILNARKSSS